MESTRIFIGKTTNKPLGNFVFLKVCYVKRGEKKIKLRKKKVCFCPQGLYFFPFPNPDWKIPHDFFLKEFFISLRRKSDKISQLSLFSNTN